MVDKVFFGRRKYVFILVHGYYTIKPLRVWGAVENDIPQLKPFIEQFLREME